MDVAANTALTDLRVNNNSLSSLNVAANTALTRLDVHTNSLTSLNVAANIALTDLRVNNNSLTSLDVEKNTALTILDAHTNSLSNLDVSTNTALRTLSVNNNASLICIEVDASQLAGATNAFTITNDATQRISTNCFTEVPDSNFRNAIVSCINTNGATTLNGQTSAFDFGCTENFNGTITARGNNIITDALVAITQFNYGNYTNKPESMNIRSLSGVEQMVNLTWLNVRENSLTTLDLSANTALTNLRVFDNSLTSLNISQNTALTNLQVFDNSLRSLDISQNTALILLNAMNNPSLTCIMIDASQHGGQPNAISNVIIDPMVTVSENCMTTMSGSGMMTMSGGGIGG